jgi:hypothetical protein
MGAPLGKKNLKMKFVPHNPIKVTPINRLKLRPKATTS